MPSQTPLRNDDDLEKAIAWFVRLHSGDAQAADWRAFTDWLEGEPARRLAYEEVEELWSALDHPTLSPAAREVAEWPLHTVRELRSPARRASRLFRGWAPIAAAAGVGGLALVGLLSRTLPRPPGAGTAYQTGVGERRSLTLGDGSRVTLNARSRIVVDLEPGHRHVTLEPGSEAAFDVVHEAARPFLVSAGDRLVRVTGTEFVVERQQGRLTVSVRRGRVEVREPSDPGAAAASLLPGQQLVHIEGTTESRVRPVMSDEPFAWRQGRLIYRGESLGMVAADLNRYVHVPIRVDADVAPLTFTGVIVVDNEDAVVRRLQALLPLSAERKEDQIVLRRRTVRP